MFWKNKKTRKKMIRKDKEQVSDILSYINHCALRTATLASMYHKRHLMEGSEKDSSFMDICDATTMQLKEAYETLYKVVKTKQEGSHEEMGKEDAR